MNVHYIKECIVQISLRMYKEKLVSGTSGNVSEFDREKGIIAITPTGMNYHLMKSEDIVLIDLNGTVCEGNYKPSSEWRLHAEIYKAFANVNALIHTHSPYATAFAVLHETIPLVLTEMQQFFGGGIPLAEYAAPGSPQLGINAVKAMKSRNPESPCCLLANHGVVVTGTTLEEAWLRASYAEDAARVYHLARQIGKAMVLSGNPSD